ncbi:DEAD-box type RNA helicase [Agyrium rufum]|nr:DEAD-box type RNA helicase [Agyrium rufum]
MAEILALIAQLQSLQPIVHWFCDIEDAPQLIDLDSSAQKHTGLATSTTDRRQAVFDCFQIFSFEGGDVEPLQNFLSDGIDRNLGRCDMCVVEYYRHRRGLLSKLKDDFDEDDVALFAKMIEEKDNVRIRRGLKAATDTLKKLTLPQRTRTALDKTALMSLFEALSCEAFLNDPELVDGYFSEPFEMIQTNNRLSVTHYVPAATAFLFDQKQSRCMWALQTWIKSREPLTTDDFEFAVSAQLSKALAVGMSENVDLNFLQRLWCGLRMIVEKCSGDIITHSLRALELDVFRMALEHLKYPTAALRFLLQTISLLLEKAPRDFWEAMGAISPTTFLEQIFNNPTFDQFLLDAKTDEDYENSALNDMLKWIRHFMNSLQISQQSEACRQLTFQLLERLQDPRFPLCSRVESFRFGLGVVVFTLQTYNRKAIRLDAVGRIGATETLAVTEKYIKQIIELPSLPSEDQRHINLSKPALQVIKFSLSLECKALRTDQETLEHSEQAPQSFSSYSPKIWDAVVRFMNRGSVSLASAALSAISDLQGLEKFITKNAPSKEKSEFNVVYGNLIHLVTQMLERINDFSPEELDHLFKERSTADALVAALFSADSNMYDAGVELIKTISGQSARKEAIGHLLIPFFTTTIDSFSWSIKRIARNKTFASCPRMLKTSADLIDVLCDSQDGVLRSRTLADTLELSAVENFWEYQWEALKVIYDMTESWSRRGVDSAMMKAFCRDTMQFSENFFDQYSIFSSAVDTSTAFKGEDGSKGANQEGAGKELLKYPAATMESMVSWLRLRDEYLASTSVKLVVKVIARLTEWQMTLSVECNDFLERVVTSDARTILSEQEKAELTRALEANLGRSIELSIYKSDTASSSRSQTPVSSSATTEFLKKKIQKAGTIDLEEWRSQAKKVIDVDEFDDPELDAELAASSGSVELLKKLPFAQQLQSKTSILPRTQLLFQKPLKTPQADLAKQIAFREKREQEKAAKKKRDLEALARTKRNLPGRGVNAQTFGAGSALGDLGGVMDKDHAPKGTGMMVSSESEPGSDDDDELDRELFGGAKKPLKKSAAVIEYENSRLKALKAQGPIKKIRQQRTARDMRARLAPDLSPLHKQILSWDFFATGDFPPNSGRTDYSLVTSSFKSPYEYQRIFEPLLLLEAWQSFLKAKEDNTSFKSFEIKIANRMTVDSFIEISTSMSMADGRDLGISESDILLLSKASLPMSKPEELHCLARVYKINRKKGNMEISYRVIPGTPIVNQLTPNTSVYGVKILSTTPIEREYAALLGLQYYDLCDEITRAKASPLLKYSDKQIEPLAQNYKLNTAQAKAVQSAIDNDAFTLIQGPPGSGKTKTIVAIVGALLTENFRDNGVAISRPSALAAGRTAPQGQTPPSRKLLVCAPSNAAVDELVMRFKAGVKTLDGSFRHINVIRLGKSDMINSNVKDVTLEELVNARLKGSGNGKEEQQDETAKVFTEHKATSDDLARARTKLDDAALAGTTDQSQLRHDIEVLKRKKEQLGKRIDQIRDSGNTAVREADINRRKIQQEILDGAHIVCATLSGSGHDMFQSINIEFETVIIDEAAQSIELSALIPLKYGCAKCIMVGDPKQLPPTVLSREAARFSYEQSLFVRMQANGPEEVHLLDTQYRMHPEISMFPCQAFYDGRLLDGPDMAALRNQPWHQSPTLGPYQFFDVEGQEKSAGYSMVNHAEVEVAMALFSRLTTDCKGFDFKGKVGIITPYKSQLKELRARFARKYGEPIFDSIDFNTTDAFQGRESEIIIFSCVRASAGKGIGFLSDIRRMNVGITRAKSSLWVLGNARSLMKGEFWRNLVINARERNRYISGDIMGMLRKPLLSLDASAFQNQPIINNGRHSPQDVEMTDAPPIYSTAEPMKQTSNLVRRPSESSYGSGLDNGVYLPSGGNGLNTKQACDLCGSFAHFTSNCDHEEAKAFSSKASNKCHRCGSLDHRIEACTIERCYECGDFGHVPKACTNPKALTHHERNMVRASENRHKNMQFHKMDVARKRQLGDHDKSVPRVRQTHSPPPVQRSNATHGNNASKRKRESPPPQGAPKGPRISTSSSGTGLNHSDRSNGFNGTAHVIKKQPRPNENSTPSVPTKQSHSSTSSIGNRPKGVTSSNGYDYSQPRPEDTVSNDRVSKNNSTSGSSSILKNQTTQINATEASRPSSGAQPPPMVRRKKDANPFIVPKKKPKR